MRYVFTCLCLHGIWVNMHLSVSLSLCSVYVCVYMYIYMYTKFLLATHGCASVGTRVSLSRCKYSSCNVELVSRASYTGLREQVATGAQAGASWTGTQFRRAQLWSGVLLASKDIMTLPHTKGAHN